MKRLSLLLLLLASSPASAGELVQQFKDPSFNGAGWTSHTVTVMQMENNAKQSIVNAQATAAANAASQAANTPMAKFMALFTSQVYSQIATQLANNLFSTDAPSSNGGTFSLDGNTITYIKTGTMIQLNVIDKNGNATQLTVPIAQFAF